MQSIAVKPCTSSTRWAHVHSMTICLLSMYINVHIQLGSCYHSLPEENHWLALTIITDVMNLGTSNTPNVQLAINDHIVKCHVESYIYPLGIYTFHGSVVLFLIIAHHKILSLHQFSMLNRAAEICETPEDDAMDSWVWVEHTEGIGIQFCTFCHVCMPDIKFCYP